MSNEEIVTHKLPEVLSRRAGLAQVVITSAVVLLFSFGVILLNTYRLNTQIKERMVGIATLAETSLASAVWQVDHASARDFIEAVFRDENVVFAEVVTGRETMASKTRAQYSGRPFTYFQEGHAFRTISVEIRKYGDWIGSFNLAVSTDNIRREMLTSAGGTMLLALLLVITITQLTHYFSRKRLFEPLKRLEESAIAIADGALEAPIETDLPGELGTLARATDDMRESVRHLIDDLTKANKRLEDHKRSLENTVRHRTEELEMKNISLNKALQEVQRSKSDAEVASLAKSRFLASMSHEIRTPMNAILGMADILWETKLTDDQSRYVQVFRTAGESLLEILDDILDLSKIEAGRLHLSETGFSLSDALDKMCAVVEPKAQQKQLDFSCSIAADVPDRLVGDPSRLRQIVLNLLGNAVKFTDKGSIRVDVERAPGNGAGVLLQFSVTDTGPGIPASKLATIFDAFTQADNSTTRKHGGTGLGLAISKQLVRMMGGRIWVESSHGNGSVFMFTARFDPASSHTGLKGDQQLHNEDLPTLPELNILMFEDSRYNAFVIQTYLKNTPCKLTLVENGEEGLAEYKKGVFDCILMDIQMPIMDGYEAIRAIRNWDTTNNRERIPIIAMTAYALAEDAKRCIEAGADQHLPKPVKKTDLFALLQKVREESPPPREDLCIIKKDIAPSRLDEVRVSIAAAHAAVERKDCQSLKALGRDLSQRGIDLQLDTVTGYGDALQEAVDDDCDSIRIKQILTVLADYVDRMSRA